MHLTCLPYLSYKSFSCQCFKNVLDFQVTIHILQFNYDELLLSFVTYVYGKLARSPDKVEPLC